MVLENLNALKAFFVADVRGYGEEISDGGAINLLKYLVCSKPSEFFICRNDFEIT